MSFSSLRWAQVTYWWKQQNKHMLKIASRTLEFIKTIKRKYNTAMASKLTKILKFIDLNADCIPFIPHLTFDKVHMRAKYKVIWSGTIGMVWHAEKQKRERSIIVNRTETSSHVFIIWSHSTISLIYVFPYKVRQWSNVR